MAKYGLSKERLEAEITNIEYNRFSEGGTQCVITLKNGYAVTGESSCIDPTIFNEEIGRQVAYNNAFDKLWGILSYGEKTRWYRETQLSWKDRVEIEHEELSEKAQKLKAVLYSEDGKKAHRPDHISEKQWNLMYTQYEVMKVYGSLLEQRLDAE